MIFINKNVNGRFAGFLFGFAQIVDGAIRVISLGLVASRFPLEVSRLSAQSSIKKMIHTSENK